MEIALKIFDGREQFWQWDLNQRLIVVGLGECEIHFTNGDGNCYVVEAHADAALGKILVNVPNILFQTAKPFVAYAHIQSGTEEYTKFAKKFWINERIRPSDYAYTETEVRTWDAMAARIDALEAGLPDEVEDAVLDYFIANPVEPYVLPTASDTILGGVKVGDRLTIENGVLSADEQDSTYTLPAATANELGGVKVGNGLSISDGVLSADGGESYTLPEASAETLGGVKVGTRLSIVNGVLSADEQSNDYTLPTASESTLGGIKVGSGLSITDGVLSADGGGDYTLPTASDTVKGGIKVGSGLSMENEVLSADRYTLPEASASTLGGVKVGSGLSIENGVLSANGGGGGEYTLPTASDTVLGGIKVGDRLSITDGVLSADEQSNDYTLPIASSSALGGVKPGNGTEVDSDGFIAVKLQANGGLALDANGALYVSIPNGDGVEY